jgi:hypothetical protein
MHYQCQLALACIDHGTLIMWPIVGTKPPQVKVYLIDGHVFKGHTFWKSMDDQPNAPY